MDKEILAVLNAMKESMDNNFKQLGQAVAEIQNDQKEMKLDLRELKLEVNKINFTQSGDVIGLLNTIVDKRKSDSSYVDKRMESFERRLFDLEDRLNN